MNLPFDDKNKLYLSSEEVLNFIQREGKVTVLLDNAFERDSDSEDVFRGLYGDEGFESDEELMNALISETLIQHTFFMQNAKKETPFNEIGMVKRLVKDGYWTRIILNDYPLKDGMYAIIVKNETRDKN